MFIITIAKIKIENDEIKNKYVLQHRNLFYFIYNKVIYQLYKKVIFYDKFYTPSLHSQTKIIMK